MLDLYKAIEVAKANGWTCEQIQKPPMLEVWFCSDPKPSYSGMGQTELEAWHDIFCDPTLESELIMLMPALSHAQADKNARTEAASYYPTQTTSKTLKGG